MTAPQAPAEEEIAPVGLVHLSLLALVVGLLTGFGAIFFRDLIGFVHNGAFLGRLAYHYDARVFTPPSRWGAFIILIPVAGSLVLTFLVDNFAPEARGTRRAGGHGRQLLPRGHHPPDRSSGEVSGLSHRDRLSSALKSL